MQKTAIVIPCYNEEKRLDTRAFSDFAASNANIHFIMVNDGSTDGTWSLLTELADKHDHFVPVNVENNSGKAEAVRQGFLKAFSMNFANIGYWDADLATPLDEINDFITLLNTPKKTMVFGSRIRLLSRSIERKAVRHYLGRLFATVTSLILKITIYDTQCGAKLFRNTRELQLVFSKPFTTNWIFDVEIIARIVLLNRYYNLPSLELTAVEHPLKKWSDVPGSKLNAIDFLKAVKELATIGKFLHAPGWKERCHKLAKNLQ
nr:glycosyltransferase [Desulfobulbaceae bacterium]